MKLYIIKVENQVAGRPVYLGSNISAEVLDKSEIVPMSRLGAQLFAAGKRKLTDLSAAWLYTVDRAIARRYTFDEAAAAKSEWLAAHPGRLRDISILTAKESTDA
jgi:hypothetical protein